MPVEIGAALKNEIFPFDRQIAKKIITWTKPTCSNLYLKVRKEARKQLNLQHALCL